MTELCYYVATTLDGHIAHVDGSFDGFAWDDEVVADFFSDLASFGTVLMGRKTYEVGVKEGKTSPYPSMRQIVFSRTLETSPDPAVELVHEDPAGFVSRLKAETDRPIWLCGGGEIASALMGAGLIDRLVLKLNPVVFGDGIRLVSGLDEQVSFVLESSKTYDCGILKLGYRLV